MVARKTKKKKSITIDELALMVQKGFADTATKNEFVELRDDVKADIKLLREDILIMINGFIGTVRKDYNELAYRVKKIEEFLFKRK